MKKITILILTLSITLMTALAVVLKLYIDTAHDEFRESIKFDSVEPGATVTETLNIEKLDLYPGSSCEYEIDLSCKAEGTYRITFNLEKGEKIGLEKYVSAQLSCGEEKYVMGLEEWFASDAKGFDLSLDANGKSKIIMSFSMPETVGNEAQGAEVAFEILITVEYTE